METEVAPIAKEEEASLMIEAAEAELLVVEVATTEEIDKMTTSKWVSIPNSKERSLSSILSREPKLTK